MYVTTDHLGRVRVSKARRAKVSPEDKERIHAERRARKEEQRRKLLAARAARRIEKERLKKERMFRKKGAPADVFVPAVEPEIPTSVSFAPESIDERRVEKIEPLEERIPPVPRDVTEPPSDREEFEYVEEPEAQYVEEGRDDEYSIEAANGEGVDGYIVTDVSPRDPIYVHSRPRATLGQDALDDARKEASVQVKLIADQLLQTAREFLDQSWWDIMYRTIGSHDEPAFHRVRKKLWSESYWDRRWMVGDGVYAVPKESAERLVSWSGQWISATNRFLGSDAYQFIPDAERRELQSWFGNVSNRRTVLVDMGATLRSPSETFWRTLPDEIWKQANTTWEWFSSVAGEAAKRIPKPGDITIWLLAGLGILLLWKK